MHVCSNGTCSACMVNACMHLCQTSRSRQKIQAASVPKPQKFIMSDLFSTPPASNRHASLSTRMSVPPAGRILTLHESDAVPDTVRDHRALWRLQSAVPEAEVDGVPSPHYLDRSLEALRKKAKGVQPPALAQQPMLTVQPHEADLVQVIVPGAPRTALTVAQAVTTAIQLLSDPDMTTEALRARAGALLVEGSLRGTGHRPVRPSVRDFFTLAEVQRGHWHCLRCSVINRRDEPSCHKCGDTFESIVGVAPDEHLDISERIIRIRRVL